MIDLKKLVIEERMRRDAVLAKEPPIPCLGRWIRSIEGDDYDCDYPYPPFCEDCIVNGGSIDPREEPPE